MNGHECYTINIWSRTISAVHKRSYYLCHCCRTLILFQSLFKNSSRSKAIWRTTDSSTNFASNDQEVIAYANTQLQVLDSNIKNNCTSENRGINIVQQTIVLDVHSGEWTLIRVDIQELKKNKKQASNYTNCSKIFQAEKSSKASSIW